MWVQESTVASLTWKYGKISITNGAYHQNVQDVTVLCTPFPALGPKCLQLRIQSQEDKSLHTVSKVLDFFVEQRVVRGTSVVLKGGGLLLDLAGFACAIYMRGIKNVTYIPTTLLAMVDATIGGKTGINFGSAKNLVGTVRHPQHIIIDITNLQSLSDREFNNGLAEVIKMAITYDAEFFEYLEEVDLRSLRKHENSEKLRYIIKKSLQLKIRVVEKDPLELNERKWLNFGHTIGHGIELATGHCLLHGECVAIGMVKILQLSAQLLDFDKRHVIVRLKKLLQSIHLPTQIPDAVDLEEVINLMLKDKKKSDSSNQIQFVMIKDIGQPEEQVTKLSIQQIKSFFYKAIEVQQLKEINKDINSQFLFPSSKSISLRLAYMAALSVLKHNRQATITNFLQSDDTKWMLHSLKSLGFHIEHAESQRRLTIHSYTPREEGTLNIGNSGVTARIILPLCASIKGRWRIECHPRMSERPNQQIIKLCKEQFDCEFGFLNKQASFPLRLFVKQTHFGLKGKSLSIDGNQSSQFITSIMLYGSFFNQQAEILTHNGTLVSQSYLQMTAQCLKKVGVSTKFQTGKISLLSKQLRHLDEMQVQTDLSSLSYPYVFSKLHNIPLPNLPSVSMQGDLLFYQYLQQLCQSNQQEIRFDFNNCTDTFMTFAVFALSPFIQSSKITSITIYNIANQRVKQSNRIHLIIKNLRKVGLRIQQYPNEIKILTKFTISDEEMFVFETANDHRLAMSLAILSTYLKKIHPEKTFVIDDKKAVDKTFPQFWTYLNKAGVTTGSNFNQPTLPDSYKSKSIVLIGDRGSGKTTLGRCLAQKLGVVFIDLDQKITQQIQERGFGSITAFVDKQGWKAFREIESSKLQECLIGRRPKQFVIATGAGIVEERINLLTLERDEAIKVYLQRNFEELRIKQTSHRPDIGNYKQISQRRASLYQQLANIIVNIPKRASKAKELPCLMAMIEKHLTDKPLKQGIILSVSDIPTSLSQLDIDPNELSSIELRLDALIQGGEKLKSIRRKVSLFQQGNSIDTLLTLRTQAQLGTYTGDYFKTQRLISKIPTQFLDHQFAFPIHYPYNPSKLFLSYHGQSESIIKKLTDLRNFNGIKKLCFRATQESWQRHYDRLGQKSICINMSDPVSRLHNRFQFAVMNELADNATGIMTVAQMKTLNTLKRVLLKR